MDPISLVVAAVVAGAAAGLQEQAANAVKDAYGALKRLIFDRHRVDVAPVERMPKSEAKRASLKEDLDDAGAGADKELLEAAKLVIDKVKEDEAAAGRARAVGVDLDDVDAEFIRISNIDVHGNAVGVDMDRVRAGRGIDVQGVRVDGRDVPQGHP